MRTALDIDDFVLNSARALARAGGACSSGERLWCESERIPIFQADYDAVAITLDLVNEHRDGD